MCIYVRTIGGAVDAWGESDDRRCHTCDLMDTLVKRKHKLMTRVKARILQSLSLYFRGDKIHTQGTFIHCDIDGAGDQGFDGHHSLETQHPL